MPFGLEKAAGKKATSFRDFQVGKTGFNSNYLTPGEYVARIMLVKQGRNTTKKSDNTVLELRLVHIDGDSKHSVGEDVVVIYSSGRFYYEENVKEMVAGITGTNAAELEPSQIEAIIPAEDSEDESPIRNLPVRVRAVARQKKAKEQRPGTDGFAKWTDYHFGGFLDPDELEALLTEDQIKKFWGDPKLLAEAYARAND